MHTDASKHMLIRAERNGSACIKGQMMAYIGESVVGLSVIGDSVVGVTVVGVCVLGAAVLHAQARNPVRASSPPRLCSS